MKKLSLFLVLTVFLTACGATEVEETVSVEEETGAMYLGPRYQADLTDTTGGNAVGTVISSLTLSDGTYTLIASFGELPPLEDGYFYEGWLVRTEGELSVISTGALESNMNFYSTSIDLTDHTQYILTLEPDDGDPAPADHVLEGSFFQSNLPLYEPHSNNLNL